MLLQKSAKGSMIPRFCSRTEGQNMANFPANINRHLDCLQFNSVGGLLLSSSSLTNRSWAGSLWYFDNPMNAPDVEKCFAGVEVECGVSDMKWVNDTKVVSACDSGAVMLWELLEDQTFGCLAQPVEHDGLVTTVAYSSDKSKVISGSVDQRVKVWDMEEFVAVASYKGHYGTVNCVACHSDPNLFVSVGQDKRMLLWDIREAKPASFIDTDITSLPTCVTWHPEKEHTIVIGTECGEIVIQDTRKSVGNPAKHTVHNRTITRLVFAPHKPLWVASASEDCSVCVTDVSSGKLIYRDEHHQDFVQGLDWDAKSHQLSSCGWDLQVRHSVIPDTDLSSPLATMDIQSEHAEQNQVEDENMDIPLTSPQLTNDSSQLSQIPVEAKG